MNTSFHQNEAEVDYKEVGKLLGQSTGLVQGQSEILTDSLNRLQELAVLTKQFNKTVTRFINAAKLDIAALNKEKLDYLEDDIKANTFLYRLLASADRSRSNVEPGLLGEIRQFIGTWTPTDGENHLQGAKEFSAKINTSVEHTVNSLVTVMTTSDNTMDKILAMKEESEEFSAASEKFNTTAKKTMGILFPQDTMSHN